MHKTPISGRSQYGHIAIIRVDSDMHTPREYGDTFYMLVDQRSDQRIGRTFKYLRNARSEAHRLSRRPEYAMRSSDELITAAQRGDVIALTGPNSLLEALTREVSA